MQIKLKVEQIEEVYDSILDGRKVRREIVYMKWNLYFGLDPLYLQWSTGKCFDTGFRANEGGVVPWNWIDTMKCMTMKFLPDVNLHGEMQNLQKIEILIWSVNYGSAKYQNPKIPRFQKCNF